MRLADLDPATLPPTLDAATVAEAVGVHIESLYDAVKEQSFPITPLRVGRRLRFPTIPVLELLGIDVDRPPGRSGGGGALAGAPTTRTSPSHISSEDVTAGAASPGGSR